MKKLILLLAASMGVMAQQTNILDTLYYPGPGTPPAKFNGSLDISWITFTACDGSVIPTGHQNFQVKNGAINIWLQKYVASSCGVIYTVRYALTNGLQQTEYWNVPASSPTNLGGVRVPPQPPPPVPYIQSINSMSPSAFFLAAGSNITLTPSGGNTITIASTGGGSGAFSALTGGTNTTAAMTVGSGASLAASGSGSIAATTVPRTGITGLGTGVATALGVSVSGSGNICLSSGSSCAGTGSNSTHYLAFSATPSWTATSGSGDFFCFHTTTDCDTALTANVTSITFSGGSPGEMIGAAFIQAAGCSSGGSGCFTVATPSGFDACQVGQIANAVTLMSWWWDGNVGHRISCTTTGPGQCPLTAAPGTPPSGQIFSWCDSTSKIPRVITDAGTILAYSKELTTGNIRVAGGANAADTGIATDTNTAHALCGGSPPAFGTSCTGGGSPAAGGAWLPFGWGFTAGTGIQPSSGTTLQGIAYPFTAYAPTVKHWSFNVQTAAGVGGAGILFGIYTADPTTGKPTTQVCSSNSTSTTSTNVTQYVAITGCNLIVNQGYVAVYSSEDTTLKIWVYEVGGASEKYPFFFMNGGAIATGSGGTLAFVGGSLISLASSILGEPPPVLQFETF